MSKILTLYNHKGGVSKTTTSFNLAHALAEHCSQNVLLVDGDPQCNLTELALAQELLSLENQVAESGDMGELPGSTVLEALRPRFNGDRPNVDTKAIGLVDLPGEGSISLFRGDIDLNEAEDRLSQAHAQRVTDEMHQRRTYVAVHDMLRRLADEHGFDYVIIDVGPSAGALTRSFFLACDQFLVPVVPDRFNYQAIGSLSRILEKWIREHRLVVESFTEMDLNISSGTPMLGGLVMQRFQRYANEPKKSYKVWMEKIAGRAKAKLLPVLEAAGSEHPMVASGLDENPTVASVPEFSGLGPIMLAVGKPVWRIEKQEADFRGVVWEQTEDRLEDFRQTHYSLAESLMSQD
ncbi:MAG TPA: ParA family protein [Solirubrobacterales bacterium]|nr:ParA family protein [Solirubrobacterales bacterium]